MLDTTRTRERERARVCVRAYVRVCACARVRVFACSRVRVFACSRVRVRVGVGRCASVYVFVSVCVGVGGEGGLSPYFNS